MTPAQRLPRRGTRLSSLFLPFPFVSFTLTLFTDVLYWRTGNLMWQNFSAWLLLTGAMFGGIAILLGLIDFLRPSTRYQMGGVAAAIGFLVMWALGVLNNFVHAGDGWTAVVPMGITLSAVTAMVGLITFGLAAAHHSRREWKVIA